MNNDVRFPQGIVGEAASIHNEGMRLWRDGRLDESLTYFLKALALKEQAGNLSAAASTIHMIGVVYAQRRDWENAGRYLLRSLDIDADDRHTQGVARSLNDLAVMCGQQGLDGDKAALLNLGNLVLACERREVRMSEASVAGLCQELSPSLREAVHTAVRRLVS